jgi:DNA-binding transcriptional LysR family regulator
MIDLKRLRYMSVLASKLNFARAAEELGITQSALTRAIQSLEQEIGMRLFDRDRSGVSMTEQGLWVLAKTERLLADANDYEHQILAASRGLEGRVRFGMGELPAFALLRPVLTECVAQTPGFRHEVAIQDADALFAMLKANEIEFFISAEFVLPEAMPIRQDMIGRFPISTVVRSGHPLLSSKHLGERYPILVADRNIVTTNLVLGLEEQVGASVQVVGDYNVLAHLTCQTDAIWITSPLAVSEDIASGRLAELKGPIPGGQRNFRVIMYSLARRTPSAAAMRLKLAFQKQFRLSVSLVPSR